MTVAEMRPLIDAALSSGGIFTFSPRGTSMLPLIRAELDTVELIKPNELSEGDIVLYLRKNGDYVLHRIIYVSQDGSFAMCGDNQYNLEYGIGREQIIAKVEAINRGGKHISCDSPKMKRYIRRLPYMRASKKLRFRIRLALSKIKRRIIH